MLLILRSLHRANELDLEDSKKFINIVGEDTYIGSDIIYGVQRAAEDERNNSNNASSCYEKAYKATEPEMVNFWKNQGSFYDGLATCARERRKFYERKEEKYEAICAESSVFFVSGEEIRNSVKDLLLCLNKGDYNTEECLKYRVKLSKVIDNNPLEIDITTNSEDSIDGLKITEASDNYSEEIEYSFELLKQNIGIANTLPVAVAPGMAPLYNSIYSYMEALGYAAEEINKVWLIIAGVLAAGDGPLPYGDIIAIVIVAGVALVIMGLAIQYMLEHADSKEDVNEKDDGEEVSEGDAKKEEKEGKDQYDKERLDNAKEVADYIKNHGGEAPEGYHDGGKFRNIPKKEGDQKLPEPHEYHEYDVNPKIDPKSRGLERVVIDEEGTVRYTNDHYTTFVNDTI